MLGRVAVLMCVLGCTLSPPTSFGQDRDYLAELNQILRTEKFRAIRKAGPIVDKWAAEDLAAATNWAAGINSKDVRRSIVRRLAQSVTRKDLEAAKKWANDLTARNLSCGRNALETVAEEWASRDPKAAMKWVSGFTDKYAKKEAEDGIVNEWVKTDLEGAVEWHKTLTNEKVKPYAEARICSELARRSPERAAEWLLTVPNNRYTKIMRKNVCNQFAYIDPLKAIAWAKGFKDEDVKAGLLATVKYSMNSTRSKWCTKDFEEAKNIVGQIEEEEIRKAGQVAIAVHWGMRDQEKTFAWMSTLDEDLQNQAMITIVSSTSHKNPAKAVPLAKRIKDPKTKTKAHDLIAHSWGMRDPQKALEWAVGIEDEGLKKACLTRILKTWTVRHPEEAAKWAADVKDEALRKSLVTALHREDRRWADYRRWNNDSRTVHSSPFHTIKSGQADLVSILLSPDGKHLFLAGKTLMMRVKADSKYGSPFKLKAETSKMAISPDGKILAVTTKDGVIKTISPDLKASTLKVLCKMGKPAKDLCFSPDGKTLAVACSDKSVHLLDVAKGNIKKSMTFNGIVRCLRFSPDGKTLACGMTTRTITLLKAEDLSTVKVLKGHTFSVGTIAYSPDGTSIVSGASDMTVRLWTAGGEFVHEFRGHAGPVIKVAVLNDNKTAVSIGGEGSLFSWDLEAKKLLKKLRVTDIELARLAISNNGTRLAVAGADGLIHLPKPEDLVPRKSAK